MGKKKENYYITLLTYIHQKMGEDKTVDFPEVYGHVHTTNPTVSEEAIKRAFFHAVEALSDFGEGHLVAVPGAKL